MKRLDNWRPEFFAAIERHRPFRFEWGAHDCAILTADCIQAITGHDPAQDFRGRYSSLEETMALLRAHGFEDTGEILASMFEEIHPAFAGVGDVAIVPTPSLGPATAPIVGAELVAFTPGGLMGLAPRTEAVRAFRIEIREGR